MEGQTEREVGYLIRLTLSLCPRRWPGRRVGNEFRKGEGMGKEKGSLGRLAAAGDCPAS